MRQYERHNVRQEREAAEGLPWALRCTCCALLVSFLLIAGCAAMLPKPRTVTVPEIVRMSQAGYPADQIIERMHASGTVYRLSASQLAYLKDEGVPDPVVNYMQQTYLDAVEHDQQLADWTLWFHDRDGFWYGGRPYWPEW